jgi:hypothetical protein
VSTVSSALQQLAFGLAQRLGARAHADLEPQVL